MKTLSVWLITAGAVTIFAGILYLQYLVIRDCGFMAFFHGAEWWWLFGYCK